MTQPGSPPTAVANCWAGLQQLHLKHGQYLECICGSPFPILLRQELLCSPLLGQAAEVSSSLGTRPLSLPTAKGRTHPGSPGCQPCCSSPGQGAGAQSRALLASSSRAALISCSMHCWVSTAGHPCPGDAVLLALGTNVYLYLNSCTQQTINVYHS